MIQKIYIPRIIFYAFDTYNLENRQKYIQRYPHTKKYDNVETGILGAPKRPVQLVSKEMQN